MTVLKCTAINTKKYHDWKVLVSSLKQSFIARLDVTFKISIQIHPRKPYLLSILYAGYSDKTQVVQNKSAEQEGKTDRQICKVAITIPSKSVM